MPGQKKTTTRSFRLDSRNLGQVEEDAEKQGISLNTMVNRLLRDYVEYGRFFSTMPVVTILRDSARYLLEAVPTESAGNIGERTAKNLVIPVIISKYGRVTRETVLNYLRLINPGGRLYTLNVTENSGSESITIIHQFGANGTTFYTAYMKYLFNAAGCETSISSTENSVSFSV